MRKGREGAPPGRAIFAKGFAKLCRARWGRKWTENTKDNNDYKKKKERRKERQMYSRDKEVLADKSRIPTTANLRWSPIKPPLSSEYIKKLLEENNHPW